MLLNRSLLAAAVTTAVLMSASPAVAGPPFICHAFELSGSPSLPWGTSAAAGWNNPDPAYDLTKLTADVTRLLTPSMPVSARMETLRRATIYASRDRAVAAGLLQALDARATASPNDANALFDAGFLTEAYRQASRVYEWDMLEGRAKEQWTMRSEPAGDGARLIDAAVALNTPQAPEMRKARQLLR
jgi:hypothetical protein